MCVSVCKGVRECVCRHMVVWSVFIVDVCVCLFVRVGANGFTEKNTAGHDVGRGVNAMVQRCVCVLSVNVESKE